MQLILRRLVQLAVVLLIVSFFTFCLVRLLPGDPTKTIIPFGTDTQRAQLNRGPRPRQAVLRAVRRPGSATSCRATSARTTRRTHPVSRPDQPVAAGVAAADALRADHRAGGRDPARRASPRTAPAPSTDRSINTDVVRAARAAELRARARARLLSVWSGNPNTGLARSWQGTSRAGSKRLFDSSRRRPREPLRHMLLPVDRARRRPDRDVHAAPAQRHDRDAAGELHHHGQAKGALRTGASSGATRSGRRASRCSPSPASTSARSSAARSSVEVIFQIPGMGTLIYQAINARQIVELQSYIVDHRDRLRADQLHRSTRSTSCSTRGSAVPEPPDRCPADAPDARGLRRRRAATASPVDAGHDRDRRGRDRPRGPPPQAKGLGFAAWLVDRRGWRSSWACAILARRVLPIDDPQGDHHRHRPPRVRSPTPAPRPATCSAATATAATCSSRLVWGGRTTLVVATVAVIIGFVLGGTLGLLGGYFRGKVDTVVSLLLDVFLRIPAVILALALVTILRTQPGTEGGTAASTPRSR